MIGKTYYPEKMRFAGEYYSLTRKEWEEYWELLDGLPDRSAGIMTIMTRRFLSERGYLHENH